MRSMWLVQLGESLLTLGFMVLAVYLTRHRPPQSPRQTQRQWLFIFLAVVFLLGAGMNWANGHLTMAAINLALVLLMALLFARTQLRTPSEHEVLQNFAADRTHCGRCEYDLTGNVSGVCPECGWTIPCGDLDADTPGWAMWWRKWEIEHLRNWRRMLAFTVSLSLVFATMAIASWYFLKSSGVVMAAAMSANFALNSARVISYGRRQRR